MSLERTLRRRNGLMVGKKEEGYFFRGSGVVSQKEGVLKTLVGVAKRHNKPYCFVSQAKQLDLLSKYHSWNISRRTLNRRLKELEAEGYFVRIRRHIRGDDGSFIPRSTLYKFCGKLFNWLYGVQRWIGSIFSVFRVPKWAHHYSNQESKVSTHDLSFVDILWKSDIKGRASPSQGIL